jgi:transposase
MMKQRKETWVGIDVSKKTCDAAIYLPLELDEAPRDVLALPKCSFERSPEGIESFHAWSHQIRYQAGVPGGKMRVIMETTGRYSAELADWFSEQLPFTRPAIEDPRAILDFKRSLKLRNKTDAIDAGVIARFGAERRPEPARKLPPEYELLRELVRQRAFLLEQRTASKMRLAEIKNTKIVADIQKKVLDEIEEGVLELEKEIVKCLKSSEELSQAFTYATSIQGVSVITTATVLAECGPLHWYTARELSSYSGLAPQVHESGAKTGTTRISRRGSGLLRSVLYMASITATSPTGPFCEFYQRLLKKGKKPMQARAAAMRKLLILIRAVVVNHQHYQNNYKKVQKHA